MNDGGKNAYSSTTPGRNMLTLLGLADKNAFLINTWNTLPESDQQWVYNNTFATVKCQTHQVQNPMPAVVIRVEAARSNHAILLDYLASEVAIEEAEIGSTNPNIPILQFHKGQTSFRDARGQRGLQ
jgi:hypothetical protein